MEKNNTKQDILDAALELFSVQGFEASSLSQIADAVGIRKASVYSHFGNKQDILEAIVAQVSREYEKHSIFAKSNRDASAYIKDERDMTPDALVRLLSGQVRYILHDPLISRARKLLTVEQFRNSRLAALQTKQSYADVTDYFSGLVQLLIRRGKLADGDCEIMAAQLCLPVSVWINLCDREPEREQEVMALIERHIRQFFEMYREQTAEKSGAVPRGVEAEKGS